MPEGLAESLQALQTIYENLLRALPRTLVALVIIALFWGAGILIGRMASGAAGRRRKRYELRLAVARLAQIATIILGGLLAIVIAAPSFQMSNLVTALGFLGVAVGFAFREVLENFFAGVLLLAEEPFRLHDQIRVQEFEGTVTAIRIRSTTILTYDGRRVVLPNRTLFTEPVVVNTAREKRRSEYTVGIGYGDDIEHAKQLMLEAVRSLPDVLADPAPEALTAELGPSSVNIRVLYWTEPPEQIHMIRTHDAVVSAIKQKLGENGIDLPFPTTQVLFHDQTEETDGDRTRQREGWPAGPNGVPKPSSIAQSLLQMARAQEAEAGSDQETPQPRQPAA